MAVIKLTEPYHIQQTRRDVRDSLMMAGEMSIAMVTYHPTNDRDALRCQACWNSIYKQSETSSCTRCYGTTYDGGFKEIRRIWALYTGDDNDEPQTKQGIWDSEQREVQLEAFPILTQRDYLVRVSRWSADYRPLAIDSIMQVGPVKVNGIKTGARFSEQRFDAVGQRAQVSKLPETAGVYKYPLIGVQFSENGPVNLGDLPPVTQPDTKVVFFPISGPGIGDDDPTIFEGKGFTFVQETPSDTWTIANKLGRYPASVNVFLNTGEMIEADEEYPDENTIILTFGQPYAGRAEII